MNEYTTHRTCLTYYNFALIMIIPPGALGSVVYSALSSGSGLASGAASLASGALTSIRRNDLVTAASELLGTAETSHETGVKWVYDYYDDWDADYR